MELLTELAAQPETRDSVMRKCQVEVQRGLGMGTDGGSPVQGTERLSAVGLK